MAGSCRRRAPVRGRRSGRTGASGRDGARGPTRIETAVEVAERFFSTATVVGIATARNFPDAVTGGTHVGRHLGPVLLTERHRLPVPVRDYLTGLPGLEVAYVYGGQAAVAESVVGAINGAR